MSRLKKFDQYMKEQDQHRMESEKDIVIQKEIDDIHSDESEPVSNIDSVDLSAQDLDNLRNSNGVSEKKVNEGAVKNLKFEITEILEDLIERIESGKYQKSDHYTQGDIDEFTDRIFSLMSNSTNESKGFDPNKPTFKLSINVGGLSKLRAQQEISNLMEKYEDPNYNIFIVPIKEGNSDITLIHLPKNESLTEQEDIPQIILDQEEARRFKETKDTLDGKSKEVYDTTSDVEKSLEKEDNEETQNPYADVEETNVSVESNDFVNESDFIIYPDGEDFKLIKESLGEETNYQSLREFLKSTFPGWEKHTSEILDAWVLIK